MKSKSWKLKLKSVFSFKSRSSKSLQSTEPTTPLSHDEEKSSNTDKATDSLSFRHANRDSVGQECAVDPNENITSERSADKPTPVFTSPKDVTAVVHPSTSLAPLNTSENESTPIDDTSSPKYTIDAIKNSSLSQPNEVSDSGEDGDISSSSGTASEAPIRARKATHPVSPPPLHLPEPPYAHDDDISASASSIDLSSRCSSPAYVLPAPPILETQLREVEEEVLSSAINSEDEDIEECSRCGKVENEGADMGGEEDEVFCDEDKYFAALGIDDLKTPEQIQRKQIPTDLETQQELMPPSPMPVDGTTEALTSLKEEPSVADTDQESMVTDAETCHKNSKSVKQYESVADIMESVRIADILTKHQVDDFTLNEHKKVASKELLAKYKASRAPAVATMKKEYLDTSLQSIKDAEAGEDDGLGDEVIEKYFTLGRLLASTTYLSNSFTSQNLTVAKQVVMEPPPSPPHIVDNDAVVLDEDPMSLYFYLGNAYAGVSMKYKTTHADRQRIKAKSRHQQQETSAK